MFQSLSLNDIAGAAPEVSAGYVEIVEVGEAPSYVPLCPDCFEPMKAIISRKMPAFWSCCAYPACLGRLWMGKTIFEYSETRPTGDAKWEGWD